MYMGFDKTNFIKNVKYLAKEKNFKIGELEASVGVSPGYISRLDKEGNTSIPGIDIICSFAKKLNISVDVLLFEDVSGVNATTNYVLSFLRKLSIETNNNQINWHRYDAEKLIEQDLFNPLMTPHVDATGLIQKVSYQYNSRFIESPFELAGDIYSAGISGGTTALLSRVSPCDINYSQIGYELYLYDGDKIMNVCASTADYNELLCNGLEELYGTITQKFKEPHLDEEVKKKINIYMETDSNRE